MQDPDSHTMKRIWDDYSKFCLRKGMRPILFEKQFDPSMQMPYDIPTLRQVIYFTELIFKNRCSYDLADYLFTFNTFIWRVFYKLYGMYTGPEWFLNAQHYCNNININTYELNKYWYDWLFFFFLIYELLKKFYLMFTS